MGILVYILKRVFWRKAPNLMWAWCVLGIKKQKALQIASVLDMCKKIAKNLQTAFFCRFYLCPHLINMQNLAKRCTNNVKKRAKCANIWSVFLAGSTCVHIQTAWGGDWTPFVTGEDHHSDDGQWWWWQRWRKKSATMMTAKVTKIKTITTIMTMMMLTMMKQLQRWSQRRCQQRCQQRWP